LQEGCADALYLINRNGDSAINSRLLRCGLDSDTQQESSAKTVHALQNSTCIYQKVTDEVITAIEQGAGQYRMPWVVRQDKGFSPISVSRVKPYRGINTLVLCAIAEQGLYLGSLRENGAGKLGL
jgi:hypothetical protein